MVNIKVNNIPDTQVIDKSITRNEANNIIHQIDSYDKNILKNLQLMECSNPKCIKYTMILKSIEICNVRFGAGGLIFIAKPYCIHCGKEL